MATLTSCYRHSPSYKKPIPLYLKRDGFRPSKPQDFGDGGAFTEILYNQYPLNMGRQIVTSNGQTTLPVSVDEYGQLNYDILVKQNENKNKIVYSRYADLVPKILKDEGDESDGEGDKRTRKEIEEEITLETRVAIEKILDEKSNRISRQSLSSKLVRYNDLRGKEKVIRMVEMSSDPLNPRVFKHKKIPKGNDSPPVTVMHSPPRPLSVKDQVEWSIAPCVSNWKNQKGYVIPLDKRLVANGGSGLVEEKVSDKFAPFSEALYVAEQKAREGVDMRAKVQKEMVRMEMERKELELREIAQKARVERTSVVASLASDYEHIGEREERQQREKIREERRQERERKRRLEVKDSGLGKKSKITRDRDRDISEKVVLGMASASIGSSGEVMHDQRLLNQEKEMDSGYANDEQNALYDKPLFTARPSVLSGLYRTKRGTDADMYGGADEEMEKIVKTDRFRPDKAFAGTTERSHQRDRPVEFEEAEESDVFDLNRFFNAVTNSTKQH